MLKTGLNRNHPRECLAELACQRPNRTLAVADIYKLNFTFRGLSRVFTLIATFLPVLRCLARRMVPKAPATSHAKTLSEAFGA